MISVPLFWCGLGGTMGVTLRLSRLRGLPDFDMTTIDTARLRLETSAGDVSYLSASVLAGATATSAEIRHALGVGSFTAAGTWRLWGEVSTDGGDTWYPTLETSLEVTI